MDNKKFQEMIDEFTLDSDAIKDVAAQRVPLPPNSYRARTSK